MTEYKILLPIETSVRELTYKIALAVMFADQGHKSYFGSKAIIRSLFKRVSPFIFFDKGYHENVSEDLIYKPVIENKGLLLSMDEEGGMDVEDFHTLNRRYPEKIFDYFNYIFIWGKVQNQFLSDNRKNYSSEKFIVSGHPRFELLKPRYRNLYNTDVHRINKKWKKYVLINCNYKYANHIRGEDFLHKNYGHRIKLIDERIKYDKIKYQHMLSLIKRIAEKKTVQLVIRPHPEEDANTYKQLFNNYKHVHVTNKLSVIPWIIGCEAMIHSDCSTAVEAALLGKHPIAFNPVIDNRFSIPAPIEVSENFDDIESLVNHLEGISNRNKTMKGKKIFEDYLSYSKNPFDIINHKVTELSKITINTEEKDIYTPIAPKHIYQKYKNQIRETFFYKDELTNSKQQGMNNKVFMKKQMKYVIETLGVQNKLKLEHPEPYLFCITRA